MANHDDLIPPIGTISAPERMFRVNWVASMLRSPSGVPMLRPDFVSTLGRRVRIVDVRESDELIGALGYVPGSDWVPRQHALDVLDPLERDAPIVIVSRGGERASELAHELERRGHRFVAAMMGGVVAWRDLGFATTRDPSILDRPDRLRTNSVPPPSGKALGRDDVERHLGDPRSVRWIKTAALLVHGRVSCVDGRDDKGVIGTPGGDAGEFLLALLALERTSGVALSQKAIDTLLLRRVDDFGRFYMHTDVGAANALIQSMRADRRLDDTLKNVFEALEWRAFWRAPPADKHEVLLEHVLRKEHIGCGHIKLMIARPDDYDARPGLVFDFLRAFSQRRWAGSEEIELVPLAGGHAEGAVLNARVRNGVFGFTSIPLISPAVGGGQAFVNHPQVASFLRKQLAEWLALQGDVATIPTGGATTLADAMEQLAGTQMGHTLGALAKGLPIFDVTFDGNGVEVVEAGRVAG